MKRALESSPSPRKCRKMDRESVGSSRSTTDTEASSSVEKPNSRARAEPHPEPSPARQAASCPQASHGSRQFLKCGGNLNDQEEEEVGLISARSPNPGRFSKWTLSRVALGLVLGLACAAWMLRGEKDIEGVTNSSLPQQKYSGLNGATGPMPPVPKKANEHNGIEWPEMTLGGDQTMTFFIVGDWGGMDGAIIPPNGATRTLVAFSNLCNFRRSLRRRRV
eukprot:g12388.t1